MNNQTQNGVMLDQPWQIQSFRLITLLSGIRAELKGFRLTRGRTCYSMVKQEFGLKGNKQKVYDQFEDLLLEHGVINERRT
jgi:hypothetical protein